MPENNNHQLFAGIDVGSSTAKAVILDRQGRICAYHTVFSGFDHQEASERCYNGALQKCGKNQQSICRVVGTGYGRLNISFADSQVSEITCHGKGAHFLFPEVKTVIDIGGQDSKVISIGPEGKVVDFIMNEKCAAGTGRFLEVTARGLDIAFEELGRLSSEATKEVRVSNMCTVFAESEIISLVAGGEKKANIVQGLHCSIADRIASMAQRINLKAPVVMTGGVALNRGVLKALKERLGVDVDVWHTPQIVGALGAAAIAREKQCSPKE